VIKGDLNYAEFDRALTNAVPEIKVRLEKKLEPETGAGGSPQPYAVVVLVLKPFLRELLDQNSNSVVVEKTFGFLEEMARSSDIQVVNLLQVGVFESLIRDPERLAAAWKHMGKETKAIAHSAARTWSCEHNLPESSDVL
jgi:hypothetical protein